MNRVAKLLATAVALVLALAMTDLGASVAAPAHSAAPPTIKEPFDALPCPANPVSTPDIEGCIEHRLLTSDAQIDKLNAKLFAGLDSARLRARFVAGHNAWLHYRRTDCGDLWASLEEGTIYPVVVGNCEVARNRQRIKDLREVIAFPERS